MIERKSWKKSWLKFLRCCVELDTWRNYSLKPWRFKVKLIWKTLSLHPSPGTVSISHSPYPYSLSLSLALFVPPSLLRRFSLIVRRSFTFISIHNTSNFRVIWYRFKVTVRLTDQSKDGIGRYTTVYSWNLKGSVRKKCKGVKA